MALDKEEPLIKKWEEVLTGYNRYNLPENIELLSIPDSRTIYLIRFSDVAE
jgi:hypothetical protein